MRRRLVLRRVAKLAWVSWIMLTWLIVSGLWVWSRFGAILF